jgi:hypothetical protein
VLATIVNTVGPDQVRRRTPNPGGVTTRSPS